MRTLEDDLKAYYRSRRVSADPAVKAAVADGVARECADIRAERDVAFDGMPLSAAEKIRCGQVADYAAFVAGQARFMGVRLWLLQAAVVALVVFVSWADPSGTMGLFACLAGAAIAVCGLPDIFASRMCGLIELERSCKFNARSVASARMTVLACANAVALFVSSCLIAAEGEVALVVAQVFAPYFLRWADALRWHVAWAHRARSLPRWPGVRSWWRLPMVWQSSAPGSTRWLPGGYGGLSLLLRRHGCFSRRAVGFPTCGSLPEFLLSIPRM